MEPYVKLTALEQNLGLLDPFPFDQIVTSWRGKSFPDVQVFLNFLLNLI